MKILVHQVQSTEKSSFTWSLIRQHRSTTFTVGRENWRLRDLHFRIQFSCKDLKAQGACFWLTRAGPGLHKRSRFLQRAVRHHVSYVQRLCILSWSLTTRRKTLHGKVSFEGLKDKASPRKARVAYIVAVAEASEKETKGTAVQYSSCYVLHIVDGAPRYSSTILHTKSVNFTLVA